MWTVLGVGVAGALGALARYGIASYVAARHPGPFPLGTFLINVAGSFVLGLLFGALVEREALSPALRVSLTVGFLGAFTTFSTFTLETFRLVEDGALGAALAYVAASLAVGLLAVWLGVAVGRAV